MSPTPHLSRRGLLAAGAASAALPLLAPSVASARPAGEVRRAPYTFRNAEIVGGGFVTGIVFNQSEPDLVYARTDIGGAYRLDTAHRALGPPARLGRLGRVGLHRRDQPRHRRGRPRPGVRWPSGTYTNDWDPTTAAILRSTDRGRTWQVTPLPFKLGGNMPGRGMGERLAIDPNRNNILYLARAGGNGLWRSTDYGETWAKVDELPQRRQLRAGPQRHQRLLNGDNQGVLWVDVRRATGSAGSPTRTHLRRRGRHGEHRLPLHRRRARPGSAVAGQPTGYIPHKACPRPRRRLPLPGHQRHRRPVRRRQGRRVEAGHRHRRLDATSARSPPPAATTSAATAA